jgi:S-adenosylmethionine synthetase
MPLPIDLAHRLTRRYEQLRVDGEIGYLAPDGKARVAVAFEDRRPARLRSVVFHATHLTRNVPPAARVESDMMEHLIRPTLGDSPIGIDDQTSIAVNPGGPVARGGPAVHSGMTGRKVTDDKYGGYVRTGRAAMCGKGPTSLERTGVYAARHVAKNVVAAGLARECEVSLTYDHDHPAPLSIDIDTFDSAKIGEAEIESRIADAFDLRVGAIIAKLNLRHLPTEHSSGFYRKLAAHGQVGREDLPLPWERTDKAEALRG